MTNPIITNPNLVDVSGDNESCVVMMNKIDYYNKLQEMVDAGIRNEIYKVTEDFRQLKSI